MFLLEELSGLVRPECVIVTEDVHQTEHTSSNVVSVSVDLLKLVSSSPEISNYISKRFGGKRTRHGSPGFRSIVMWCLSSKGYTVNSLNLTDVSFEDVAECWEFIETVSISSTAETRELISKCTMNRSSVGFRSEMGELSVKPREHRQHQPPSVKQFRGPIQVVSRTKVSLSHGSMAELLADDITSVSLRTADPTRSTLELSLLFSKNSETGQERAPHR